MSFPYFPADKTPNAPTDILGRPLAEGDQIAWASGKYLRYGWVERIRFKRRVVLSYEPDGTTRYAYSALEECPQNDPEVVAYTVTGRRPESTVTGRYGNKRAVQAIPDIKNIIRVEFSDNGGV